MKDFTPSFFNDFGKAVSDFLKPSKFDLGRQVEVTTKSSSGVSFTAHSNLLPDDGTGKLSVKAATEKADLEGALQHTGATNVKVTSTKAYDGLKVVVSNDNHPGKGTSVHQVDMSYKANHVAFTSTLASNKLKDYRYNGSLAFGHAGVSVGGNVVVADGDVADFSVGAQYQEDDFVLTVKTLKKSDSLLASYSHVVNGDATVMAAFSYDLTKGGSSGQNLVVGSHYRLDENSSVDAMYTTDGNISAVYETNVRQNVKLALGVTSNIDDFSRQKFGAKITLC